MYADLGLPFPTIILACQARRIGGFGLVGHGLTNPYHAAILGPTLPRVAFTKLDLRRNTRHTVRRLCVMWCYNGLGTVVDCGQHPT
jgi:hypothetical protein